MDQIPGGLNATAQVSVTVLDYNDNAPQFSAVPDPLQIPEGEYSEDSPGEIFTIGATDADLGVNGEVTVSLSSPHPLFRMTEVRPAERIVGFVSAVVLCQWSEISCCAAERDAAGGRRSGPGEQGHLRADGEGL